MRITISGDWREKLEALRVAAERSRVALQKAAAGGGDPEMLRRLGDVDAKQNIKSFATEGAASGESWPDILQGVGNFKGYKSWKARNWPGRKLNVWRGDTKDSVTKAGAKGRIVEQRGNTIVLGTSAKLAMKMQTGESHGEWQKAFLREKTPLRKKLKGGKLSPGSNWFTLLYREVPARPVVRKSSEQMAGLKREVAREIMRVMAREAGTSTPLGRYLSKRAGEIPRWNG